jgi:hypothetical protein
MCLISLLFFYCWRPRKGTQENQLALYARGVGGAPGLRQAAKNAARTHFPGIGREPAKKFQKYLAKTLKFAEARPLKKDNRQSGPRILL